MRALFILSSLFFSLVGTSALAATLTVQVARGGKPVANAVVTLHAVGRPTPPARINGRYMIDQKDIQFRPFVSVVPVDAEVSFPNLDAVRHHVYSFSSAKRFELKLYAKDQTRSVHFDRAGVVPLGCNIHDSMSAFLFVTDSAWTAKTDAMGRVAFPGLPAGTFTMTTWHPYLRAPGNQIRKSITMAAADHRELVPVSLRAPPMHDKSGY